MDVQRPDGMLTDIAVPLNKERPFWQWRLGLSVLMICISLGTFLFAAGNLFKFVQADPAPTAAGDTLRTGWYPTQTNLSPELVSGGTFGQVFSATIDGQVYAQPLVSQGVLFVVTETNNVYGLNPLTGTQIWKRNFGVPFNPADVTCSDLAPAVGITGTPVIDPATHIAYFTSKTYVSGTSGPAAWYMHALNVATGVEQSGFPVKIQGVASNAAGQTFNATMQLQRPGLLLLDGVIYAAFGGHCDRKPYEGWIAGVTTSGRMTTLWSDVAGSPTTDPLGPGGGIWMPSGGLVSDGPGQIIFSSGNGEVPPSPSPGKPASPANLAQTVTRLVVQADGSLKAVDFFSPYDADLLNRTDSDVGAGSPVELPPQYFGTRAYPHLIVEVGKQGYLFLLNADNLGGRGEGPNNSDAIINRIGPNGGVWGKPAVWPGDGGYVYTTTAAGGGGSGKLKAYHYGLDGSGKPTLSLVGTSPDAFGFGSSSPVITSSATASGSALVWVIWSSDGTGVGAQLRAYDPVPVNGVLKMVYSAPIGTASKFNSPGVDTNRIYVGTRDGHVLGFGAPVSTQLTGAPLDLGRVVLGHSVTAKLVLTAQTGLTVSRLALDNGVFTADTSPLMLPANLSSGQTISIPITFTPAAVGLVAGDLTVTTSLGQFSFGVSGTGQSATGTISVAPTPISFGGIAAGGSPVSATTTFTNVGATPITITGSTLPVAPFSVSGMPATNSVLAPDASVTATLTFAPTQVGSYTDKLVLTTTGGVATVPLSGTAGTPGKLTISPTSVNVGNVPIGSNAVAKFTVSNTGGSPVNITRSKYPVAGVGFTPYSSLPEGTVIAPGTSLVETVLFSPSTLGTASDSWALNGDDASGVQTVTFTGTGVARVANPTLPSLSIADASLIQPTTGTVQAHIAVTLNTASTSIVTVNYATKDGSATVAGGDYVATSGTLTFNPGETSKTITVTVNGHVTYGPATTFTVSLANPKNATLGDPSGKVWLDKLSGLYGIYVGDVAVKASSSGTVNASFPVSLSAVPVAGESVTVTVSTADGTARAGTNYSALSPTVITFKAGEKTQNVVVPVKPSPAGAGNATFTLNLTSPSANASIADAQAIGTIVNGGAAPPPSIYITDTTLVQPTSGTASAVVTLSLSAASAAPVTVNYATHDGTATIANGYYQPTNGSVTFNPGETSKTVSIVIKGDASRAADTYLYLNLTQASNAVIGDTAGRITLLNQLGRYAISVTDTSVLQNASALSLVQVAVSLDTPVAAGQSVTVQVSTKDGSAVAGANGDYVAVPLTSITFSAGQQVVLVPIYVNARSGSAASKSFTLTLQHPSPDAQIAAASATITLVG